MLPETEPSLLPFFNPQGVAVIGVSTNPAKLGYGIAYNLVKCGYSGGIHFVNPKGGVLLERPIYPAIDQVPDPVDLAVLLIPAQLIPPILEACGRRGIRAAIIVSGGFREAGATGAALEDECLQIARRFGLRLMGPNCIGLMDTHLPLDTTFLPPPSPPAGEIAFISHSGAICAAIVDWSRGQGFGFSRLISLGNQVDVTETDVLVPVAADPHSRVVTLYLEGIANGRSFVSVAGQVTRQKPVLALKVGRTGGGQKAASSHTGALAGTEEAYEAAFRRAGIQRAATASEMFDWAKTLAWSPLPKGPHVAILTNAGGPGVMAADAVEEQGLQLAALQQETHDALCGLLSDAAGLDNPVDMLAAATPEQYADSLSLVLADRSVDAVLLILPPPPMFTAAGVARQIIPLIQTAEKPVVVALMGYSLVQEALAYFRAMHVPAFAFPETAASALAALYRRTAYLARTPGEEANIESAAAVNPPTALVPEPTGWFSQAILHELLSAYGLQLPKSGLACSAMQATDLARRFGFPLALKIDSAAIAHKSDVGGVRLDLKSSEEVAAAYRELLQAVHKARPEAQITGLQVQQMIPSGQDVIAGVTRDPQFGPLIMFGSGGVEVEGLRDVAFALAPLTVYDGRYILQNTWAGRKLDGYRNIAPVDKEAVLTTLAQLGRIARDYPQITEIEINPLRVTAEGAFALDVRARQSHSEAKVK
ncbi:MAG: acetate--CoA ligase family protein [Candidatus Promineifilaceae bacterium]|nr:acetate--CoA ligase family protein [Candidatus Promineifilaceae bacterium]